jgi:FkbM family methyltransferase
MRMAGMKSLSESARRFYRSYRSARIPLGHSLVKRLLGHWLGRDQEICLRSGLKLKLDLSKKNQAGIFWYDGDADVALSWAIRELVPVGGVFVDCGANCGLMGLQACQCRQASVILVEPHPRLARSIEANIRLNRFEQRAELIEAAASDASGEVTFYENPTGDDGTHSIHADWGTGEKRVLGKVRCETLKDIIERKQLPQVDFLKIDTEGNDFAVLQGLGEYLRPSFTRLIYVEVIRDRESIYALMASRGYVGFCTIPRRGSELVRLQRISDQGGRVCFFRPLGGSVAGSNALWCGKDSAVANYLNASSATAV